MNEKLRIYVDTSVFGGCFDEPFKPSSNRIMEKAVTGEFTLLISDLVTDELKYAPEKVKNRLKNLPSQSLEILPLTDEVTALGDAYLEARILTPKSKYDAGHVAMATFHQADAIVSWNFKHIVQLDKMRAYNKVNSEMGYRRLEIISPLELFT